MSSFVCGLVASVALLAGCGGSVTKADVIARADAICSGTLRSIRAAAPPAGTSTAQLARYFERVVPIVAGNVSSYELPFVWYSAKCGPAYGGQSWGSPSSVPTETASRLAPPAP
jgi:hypothetical protein